MEPIKEVEETVINLSEVDFNKLLNSDRVRLMIDKIHALEDRIAHIKKIRSRWVTFENLLRFTSMTISFSLTVASAVINVLPTRITDDTVVRALTAGFTAFSAFSMVGSEGTMIAYVRQRKRRYRKEIQELKQRVDRSYLFYEKSRTDGVISNDELIKFYQIMKEEEPKV